MFKGDLFMLSVLKIVFTVLILFLLIRFLWKPVYIKTILNKLSDPIEYNLHENAKIQKNYILYSKEGNKNLTIIFHGGAFLFSDFKNAYGFSNSLYEHLKTFDILIFQYPVRFDFTIEQAMIAINDILKNFINRYDNYTAIGVSAGVLLMGTFLQKEMNKDVAQKICVPQIGLNISKFVAINGVFDTNFNNSVLNKLFSFYIMRGTSSIKNYSCYNLSVPKLIISNTYDFLYEQTKNYIKTEQCSLKIFQNKNLDHRFIFYQNLNETNIAIKSISSFLQS